ncbi:MAG: SDR family oxidoreductase [Chitinophagales bacterium]|nr:SDR family oxidoreductase [Chitinophagales bacterium]
MSTYLIIGGSSGIGKQIVSDLLSQGASVISMSRSQINAIPQGHIKHFQHDVCSDESFPEIESGLDGIVYCPGSINLKPFKGLSINDFQEDMNINFFGLVRSMQAYSSNLNDGASVVLFSTVAVNTGMPFHTSVSAAKSAVEGFGRSLAAELAPKIRVNIISPSLTDTPMSAKLLKSERQKEASNDRHPLKRVGTVNDISNMATFLLSSNSSWISGQVFNVDGGMSTLKLL